MHRRASVDIAFMEKTRQRYVLAGAAAAVGLLMLSSAVVSLRADRALETLSRQANALRQQYEADPVHHDAPWGTTSPGRAFEHYDRAAELTESIEDDEVRELLKLDDAALAAEAELRARWQPVVAAVREGAHRSDRRMVRPFDRPDRVLNLLSYRRAVNVTVLAARCARAEGKLTESVEMTLDAMTVGVDCVRDGVLINQMVGCALVAIGCEAWASEDLDALDGSQLQTFATGLAQLDARLPSALRMEHEFTVMVGLLFDASNPGDWRDWHGGASWRHGFSDGWMTAEAFSLMAEGIARMDAVRDAPWPQREAEYEREAERMRQSGNAVAAMITPNLACAERSLRRSKAEVRLLRTAVDLLRGEAQPFPDPLGEGDLTITTTEGMTEISSVGDDWRKQLRREVRAPR